VLLAAGMSSSSAEVVANTISALTILGLGLLRLRALPAFERRLVLAPKITPAVGALIGAGLALGLRIAVGIVVSIGEAVDPSLCKKLVDLGADKPSVLWHKILLALALVVLAPLGEELVFRGLLLRGLVRRRMQFPLAAIISGVLFAVAHAQYWTLWPLLIGISLFGVTAAWVYRRWGSPANVTMHAVFNAVVVVTLFVDLGLDSQSTDCG
jgi:membrane protease YdiL (CAAX protease family)